MAVSAMKFTKHARHRSRQMGLSLERIARVVSNPDLTYTTRGQQMHSRHDEPDFRVVADGHTVITVLEWTYDRYERAS
jgi:hypothetical protein